MGFFKRWRMRRAEKAMLKKLQEVQPFVQSGSLLATSHTETVPQGEVTGVFKNLRGMLDEAIEVKRHTQEAATRITNAIGAPPEESKRKA